MMNKKYVVVAVVVPYCVGIGRINGTYEVGQLVR